MYAWYVPASAPPVLVPPGLVHVSVPAVGSLLCHSTGVYILRKGWLVA
jgi:hypothetical protein